MTDKLPDHGLFDFGGSFFPSDSVVAFFNNEADANDVKAEINTRLPTSRCEVFSPELVHEWASDGLTNAGFIASLGYGIKIVEKHEELSKAGKWSIIAHVPGQAGTEVAMTAIRKKPFFQANKYNKLTVEDLS
jgi:hypothetical protein